MLRSLLVVVVALAVPAVAQAKPAAVTWCGNDEVAADRVPDIELSSTRQVRFVYAVPSDGEDDFAATASGIATDAAWIHEWWQREDPTRAPRFDRYPFPGCTDRFGSLDIGFVRLPNPASYYTARDTPSLRLDRDLQGSLGIDQKTIVYYDGPISNRRVCGETDYLSDAFGGDEGIVYVYLRSGCRIAPAGSGGTAEVAAHELIHNLGAVTDEAPNECTDNDSHVCDSEIDILYPFIGSGSTLDTISLDLNHDDYYGHTGAWWDVQDSGWLTRFPQFPFSLAVAGSGTLVAHAGGRAPLPCDIGCSALMLDSGTKVSVRAAPSRGWVFAAWSGACAGAAPACTFAIAADTTAAVTFVRALRVTVKIAGRGKVARTDVAARTVRLRATPARGWRFRSWSGACRGGSPTCIVGRAARVGATFVRR